MSTVLVGTICALALCGIIEACLAVYLALRNGALREENRGKEAELVALRAQLVVIGKDFAIYRSGAEGQRKAWRRSIKELEREIDRMPAVPGAVRGALNRMFSQAQGRGDDAPRVVPEPATAAADPAGDPLRGPE